MAPFRSEVQGDALSGSTERSAQSKFVLPPFGPHQQQIGDVGASDEQNHSDAAHKHPKEQTDIADNLLLQRQEAWGQASLLK